MWIDEILAGSAAGEERHSEYGWEDDYWIEVFLLRENGPAELLELRCEWAFEVSLNLFRSERRFMLRILTDMRKLAGVGLFPESYGVFQFRWGLFFFHNEAELRESSMYSDFGVCAPSQEGLAQATEL